MKQAHAQRVGRDAMTDGGIVLTPEGHADRLDRVIEWLIVALLAFMPLAFGAVEAWSEELVVALAATVCVCFALKGLVERRRTFMWNWAYVPLAAFIAVAVIQLIPWPLAWIRLFSPGTAALKTDLLADLPDSAQVLSHTTISLYSYGTLHDLRLVLAVAAIFVVALNVYRRPEQIKRLLAAIAIIGGLFAALALAQILIGNGKIYWFVTMPGGGARSGPFVNHSHYGQFMNLSIGAALGLIFVRLREVFGRSEAQPDVVAEYLSSREARPLWVLLAVVVLGVGTVFLSMTRGGMISTLAALAFTALALTFNRPLRSTGWIMALLALGAFTCVLYLGFDAVYERLGTLTQLNYAQGSRWQILKDVAVAWTKFPLLGAGLGTHEVVYPMFDRSSVPELAAYAENEYAQTAEETGLAGLAALGVFGIWIGIRFVRAARSNAAPICAAAYGLGFGLVAILVHSLSDFGQHVPANAVLSAVFCALMIRLSEPDSFESVPIPLTSRVGRFTRPLWVSGLILTAAVWAWALLDANGARTAAAHWAKALHAEQDLMSRQWQGGDEEYVSLLECVAAAQDQDPGNVKYRHWLNVFRWRAVSRTTDPNAERPVLSAQAREFAGRIAGELNRARVLCPTFGPSWVVLGQLERYVLGRPDDGAQHIRTGVRLAPCDATARLVAGTLEADEGKAEEAWIHLQKAVELDKRLFEEVVSVLAHRLDRPDLALRVAGDDPRRLAYVATSPKPATDCSQAAAEARDNAVRIIEHRCQEADASVDLLKALARVYREENRIDEAIECYRRLLALDYGDVQSRFNLARLLAQARAPDEAVQQARICLHLRPEFAMARQLIERLSANGQSTEHQNP